MDTWHKSAVCMLKLMLYCRLVRTNLKVRVRSRSGKLPLNLSDDKTCKIGVMTPRSTSMYKLSCTISRHLFDPTEPDRIHKLSNMYIEDFLLQDLRPCTLSGHKLSRSSFGLQDLSRFGFLFWNVDMCGIKPVNLLSRPHAWRLHQCCGCRGPVGGLETFLNVSFQELQ